MMMMMMNEIPNESRVFQVKYRCVLAAVALLFSFFFFRESKKKNEHAKKMNKKRRDFLCTKGGQVVTYLFLYYRSTGVTHTHSIPRHCAQNKESEEEREKRRGAKHFFFYRR